MSDILNRHPNWKLRVLVVWETIRGADSLGPPPGTYVRIPDRRVRQFWDRSLILSDRMVRDARANPKLLPANEPLNDGTILWDAAAVFPRGARWDRELPRPVYYGRPVAAVTIELERSLAAQMTGR
ncbi:MAG: hypothetical protein ACM3PF_00805 [Bacteroidota bacterium]